MQDETNVEHISYTILCFFFVRLNPKFSALGHFVGSREPRNFATDANNGQGCLLPSCRPTIGTATLWTVEIDDGLDCHSMEVRCKRLLLHKVCAMPSILGLRC